MTGDIGPSLTRSPTEVFDKDFIPFNQHMADERSKVFEFASVDIHVVVFVFD